MIVIASGIWTMRNKIDDDNEEVFEKKVLK